MSVRVLLVAPMNDLPGAVQEVYAVERAGGLTVERLAPDARRRELLHALHDQGFDVLWFATHGDEDGVALTEEDKLSTADLISMVRGAGLKGVMLNSCGSANVAEQLHDETGVDVVCTITETPDLTAFQTGAIFARWLGKTKDFRAAFDAVESDGAGFRYVPAYRGGLVVASDRFTFSTEELRTIFDAINDVRNRLSVVEVDVRYVRQDLDNLRGDLRSVRQDFDNRRGDLKAPAQWAIVIAGLLMSMGLFGLLWFVVARL